MSIYSRMKLWSCVSLKYISQIIESSMNYNEKIHENHGKRYIQKTGNDIFITAFF